MDDGQKEIIDRLDKIIGYLDRQGRALHHIAGCASETLMRAKAGEKPEGPPKRTYLGGGKSHEESNHDEASQGRGRPRAAARDR